MKIFVGYDSREDIAYQVCKYSIISRQADAEIIPIKLDELKQSGIYTREIDPLSSTEFTFTRFLVPYLMNYEGWAVFIDCDFLCQIDIKEVFNKADDNFAVMVVKHEYTPSESIKMDGQKQLPYPRKNWSSMVLWNCGHPSNKIVTTDLVNTETGQFLHRFQWLDDEEIGELHYEYNWLVGWYKGGEDGTPKLIHYTEGGPWFENHRHCEFGAVWERELCNLEKSKNPPRPPGPFDHIPPEIESVFKNILKYRVDPSGEVYGQNVDDIIEDIKMLDNKKVFAVDGRRDSSDSKGLGWDPYMESFVLGCGGQITNYDKVEASMTPVVFRGITKFKHMQACAAMGRDFYYIDTGYFGNVRKKLYHRITKNSMQNLGPIITRPSDRLAAIGWSRSKFKKGRNILICPPSAKAMNCFNLNLDQWMTDTISTIKKYTDRPIVILLKGSRRDRTNTDTIEMALSQDVHCLVTFNSIAASEALLFGKPAITLGPNAAQPLCSQRLSDIENPYIPTAEEVEAWAAHLSYAQFTELEMRDGTAYRILNEPGDIWVPTHPYA